MKAMLQASALEVGTGFVERSVLVAPREAVQKAREAEIKSLAALVRQVHRCHRWENVVWAALALASLVLLVFSFQV